METVAYQKEFIFTKEIAITLSMRFFQTLPWNMTDESYRNAYRILNIEIQELEELTAKPVTAFFNESFYLLPEQHRPSFFYKGRTAVLSTDSSGIITDIWPHTVVHQPKRNGYTQISEHVIARFLERFGKIPEKEALQISRKNFHSYTMHAKKVLTHAYQHAITTTRADRNILLRRPHARSISTGIQYYFYSGIIIVANERARVLLTVLDPLYLPS